MAKHHYRMFLFMNRIMTADGRPSMTISQVLGELTWLMTQSARHQGLPIAELTWLLMPAISHRQFHLFYDGDRPVGAATWAMLDAVNERKFLEGRFRPPDADAADWQSGDRRWLIDLITPFATDQNKQADVMFADLVTGRLRNIAFKMLKMDTDSAAAQTIEIDAGFGERLAARTRAGLVGVV